MAYLEIWKGGSIIRRSVNLRGLIAYCGKVPVDYVSVRRDSDGGAIMSIEWNDGATARVSFADFIVAQRFVITRRNRWDISQTMHWPDWRTWSAHPGSARAVARVQRNPLTA